MTKCHCNKQLDLAIQKPNPSSKLWLHTSTSTCHALICLQHFQSDDILKKKNLSPIIYTFSFIRMAKGHCNKRLDSGDSPTGLDSLDRSHCCICLPRCCRRPRKKHPASPSSTITYRRQAVRSVQLDTSPEESRKNARVPRKTTACKQRGSHCLSLGLSRRRVVSFLWVSPAALANGKPAIRFTYF